MGKSKREMIIRTLS